MSERREGWLLTVWVICSPLLLGASFLFSFGFVLKAFDADGTPGRHNTEGWLLGAAVLAAAAYLAIRRTLRYLRDNP